MSFVFFGVIKRCKKNRDLVPRVIQLDFKKKVLIKGKPGTITKVIPFAEIKGVSKHERSPFCLFIHFHYKAAPYPYNEVVGVM